MVSTLKLKPGKTELSYTYGFLCVQITLGDVNVSNSVIKLSKVDKLATSYLGSDNKLRFNFGGSGSFTISVEDHKEANEVVKYLLSALTDTNNQTTTL